MTIKEHIRQYRRIRNYLRRQIKKMKEMEKEYTALIKWLKELQENKEKILVGNSWRRILSAEKGYTPPVPDTLLDYEEKVIQSGVNYVRHDAVDDYDLVKAHVDKMNANGICVELTLFDNHDEFNSKWGNPLTHARNLKDADVIFEVGNEFLDDSKEIVEYKQNLCNVLRDEGVEVSCGAWGNSNEGQSWAREFNPICSCNTYITVHRPYPPLSALQEWISQYKDSGKRILWNEVLPEPYPTGIKKSELGLYVKGAVDAGASGVNVYGDWFNEMGALCKELNA